MRYGRILLILVCLNNGYSLFAQQVPSKRYSSQNGMFSDRITCMAQDSSGYLWFGTYFGLMRYDGYRFVKIELPTVMKNKFVQSLINISDTVYAGFRFDGGLMQWCSGKARPIILPHPLFNNINALTTDRKGKLIIAAQSTSGPASMIWEYQNGKFKHLLTTEPSQGDVTCLAVDNVGSLWVGTEKNVLVQKQTGQVEIKFTGVNANDIRLNGNGTIVVAIENPIQKIHFLSEANGQYRVVSSISSDKIVFVAVRGNNARGYWGVDEKGLVYLNENLQLTRYTIELPPKVVVGPIFVDKEGSVWLTTEAGAIKVSSLQAEIFQFNEWAPSSAGILALPDGSKIATNAFSLFHYKNNAWSKVSNISGSGLFGKLLQDYNGNIWITEWNGQEGVWRTKWKDGEIVSKKFYGRYNNEIIHSSDIKETSDGMVWVAGATNIFFFRKGEICQRYNLLNVVPAQIINIALHEKKKIAWVGTNGKGIYKLKYAINDDGHYRFEQEGIINARGGLRDLFIRGNSVVDPEGNLWVGSRNAGLARITDRGNRTFVKYFAETDGLAGSRISRLRVADGFTWVSTSDGIYKIKGDSIVAKYNTGDGLLGNYVFDFITDSNYLWTVSAGGVTKLRLSADRGLAPRVSVLDFKILGLSDTSLFTHGVRRIPFEKNSVGFSFTANSFIDESKVQYTYKLDGYDKAWSLPSTTNTVNYSSLKPGKYNFQVMAVNAKGVWSDVPTHFRFEIVQPFYLRTWFLSLILFTALALFLIARQLRLNQKLRLQNLRLQIARDLHDDVGSALGSINILTKTAQRRIQEDRDAGAIVEKIGDTTLQTLDSMDDIIWTINPEKEKITDLMARMQNFAQPLLESLGIEFRFKHNTSSISTLSMPLRRELYLMFKESIYNAIKHSGCTVVEVNMHVGQKHLDLHIVDNGSGIQKDTPGRNGLKNLAVRAEKIQAKLVVDSINNKGTCILIHLPSKSFNKI